MIYNLEFHTDSNYYGKTGELPCQICQMLHLCCVACMGNLHSKLQIVTIRKHLANCFTRFANSHI